MRIPLRERGQNPLGRSEYAYRCSAVELIWMLRTMRRSSTRRRAPVSVESVLVELLAVVGGVIAGAVTWTAWMCLGVMLNFIAVPFLTVSIPTRERGRLSVSSWLLQ